MSKRFIPSEDVYGQDEAANLLDDHERQYHTSADVNEDVHDRTTQASTSYHMDPAINLLKRKSEVSAPSENHYSSNLATPIEELDFQDLAIQVKNFYEQSGESQDHSFNRQVYSGQTNLESVGSKLLSGSFGIFETVKDTDTKKTLRRKMVKGSLNHNEVLVPLKLWGKPNICQVFGICNIGIIKIIVMEDAGESLDKLVERNYVDGKYQGLDERELRSITYGMLQGLSDMASEGFTHFDLKPANICVKVGMAKIIDFGGSRNSQTKEVTPCTPEYLSPEALKWWTQQKKGTKVFHEPPDHKTDAWSGNMISQYLVKGHHPAILYSFPLDSSANYLQNYQEKQQVLIKKITELTDPLNEFFLDGPDFLKNLLAIGFKVDKEKRFSAQQCLDYLKNPWDHENRKKRKTDPDDAYKGELDIRIKCCQSSQGLTDGQHIQGESQRERGTPISLETKAQSELCVYMDDHDTGYQFDDGTRPSGSIDAPYDLREHQKMPGPIVSLVGGTHM